tara:strand:- start:738 stop:977 length:240 start_codon:yes stop_codon:yes gene_type:complete
MAAEKNQNVQDIFLNTVRKKHAPVTIFLVNGVKLQGNINWFDNFSILLKRERQVQLIYKHAISTIMPSGELNFFEEEQD